MFIGLSFCLHLLMIYIYIFYKVSSALFHPMKPNRVTAALGTAHEAALGTWSRTFICNNYGGEKNHSETIPWIRTKILLAKVILAVQFPFKTLLKFFFYFYSFIHNTAGYLNGGFKKIWLLSGSCRWWLFSTSVLNAASRVWYEKNYCIHFNFLKMLAFFLGKKWAKK